MQGSVSAVEQMSAAAMPARIAFVDPPPQNWSTVYAMERRINSVGEDQMPIDNFLLWLSCPSSKHLGLLSL